MEKAYLSLANSLELDLSLLTYFVGNETGSALPVIQIPWIGIDQVS